MAEIDEETLEINNWSCARLIKLAKEVELIC